MNDDAPEAVHDAPPEALNDRRQEALELIYTAIAEELSGENVITQRVRNLAQAAAMLR